MKNLLRFQEMMIYQTICVIKNILNIKNIIYKLYAGNETIYNTEVLKSNLSDYNDAYISVKSNIAVTETDGTTIDDAEDIDLVMTMYNLTEYSSNHSETRGSLWFHSKDEAGNF